MQTVNTLDGEQVRGDTADAGTHAVQHLTELLQIRLAGCIVDGGSTFCKHGCHHNVGCTGYRCLVEQHVGALQLLGRNLIHIATFHTVKGGTEFLES